MSCKYNEYKRCWLCEKQEEYREEPDPKKLNQKNP